MKKIVLIIGIITLLSNISFAQEDKTITLTVSGQGKTQDEAKQNALRNAIEQAFGTFISSNTEILNDELIKDEIVSVSNGNIQKFEVISEVQIPDGAYATTLKATVSIIKLTSFCESKGISVEFKGSLFTFNINQQILNEKNEEKAIEDICQVIRNIADVSFDFTITASDPISIDASNSKWRIPMYISVYRNSNFDNISKILYTTLKGISLSLDEAENYIQLGKKVYPISIALTNNDFNYIILRNDKSISQLLETFYYFNHSLQNFKISNGIAVWSIKDYPENLKYIYDYGFRLFAINRNFRNWSGSVFYKTPSSTDIPYGCNIGLVKDPEKVKSRCGTGNRTLNYHEWSGNVRAIEVYSIEYNPSSCGSFPNLCSFVKDQFTFLKKIRSKSKINGQTGLVISFIPTNNDPEVVRFYYEDIRNINEINKISEYKVLPIKT